MTEVATTKGVDRGRERVEVLLSVKDLDDHVRVVLKDNGYIESDEKMKERYAKRLAVYPDARVAAQVKPGIGTTIELLLNK